MQTARGTPAYQEPAAGQSLEEQQLIVRRLYETYVARGYVDTRDWLEMAAQVRAERRGSRPAAA